MTDIKLDLFIVITGGKSAIIIEEALRKKLYE